MGNEEEQIKRLGWELGQAIQTILVGSFDRPFEDVVRDYRRVEEDFVNRPNSNEFHVLETRRRVAEAILLAAHSHREPFDTCRNAWNDLLRLGFTNFRTRCTESWLYADCCLFSEEPLAGLAVLQPLIIDIEYQLKGMMVANKASQPLQDELARLKQLSDELQGTKQ